MSAPIILITGTNGQVGFELRRSFAPLGRVVALDRSTCDLSEPDALRRAVRQYRPDVVLNPAAYTAVDRAQAESELAYAVNGVAPGILAEEARALGSLFVHYSTDYVFDGEKSSPYVETDAAGPRSVYGKSKLAGEQAVATVGGPHLVLRTSWVAGQHGSNFAKTMLRLGRERETFNVVADQFGAPTSAALIADVTAQIVGRFWLHGARDHFPTGLYHLAAAGETSWHLYAREVLTYAAQCGAALKASPERVVAIPACDYPLPAPRPTNSRLDTSRLRETFGIHLPGWQDGIYHLLDGILS